MKRQFINLVQGTWKSGSFTMHCIRSSSLFHPRKHKGSLPVEAKLPKPVWTLSLSKAKEDGGNFMFIPFGSARDKIITADHDGIVLVHDISQKRLSSMPSRRLWNVYSVAITVGDDLYLINRCPYEPDHRFQPDQSCFQALIHGEPPADVPGLPGRYWHSLPPPPYVEASGYERSGDTRIDSSAVVGDSIWVSARGGIGTYSFDTGSRQWSKVGSWELPFRGDAQYVPELGRWLGFSRGRENQFLCASDLSAAATDGAAPTLCRVWQEDMATYPENWTLLTSDLVRVDARRFCIARQFEVCDDEYHFTEENFAVFTGVELKRSDTAEDGIQVVKHKSVRYNFDRKLLQLVC
ncbi:hypothetical protein QYE76_014190 [Lolium multiflorum]|uniref:Uncharacterized protein n=1 Tax=Lolium multiflorum TaxID=4521 RepID=A0AAD8U427_LOLMU|nr:hypothetical protein QYE76_014190 [Lolium multiflorum]